MLGSKDLVGQGSRRTICIVGSGQIRRRRRHGLVLIGRKTSARILDEVAANAAIFGVYGRDALFAPRFLKILEERGGRLLPAAHIGRLLDRIAVVHPERDLFDHLEAPRRQLTLAACARAIATNPLLFAEQLGRQIRRKVSPMLGLSDTPLDHIPRHQSFHVLAQLKLIHY
ncbi:hypothetical protein BpHYR1_001303 [Brachionus plicatilis]|uniref:Uncharacterized protein n=1 Tax=Brachionus plicatilis TaxID=10195 RepID=A0A3M7T7U9_BRAPC|nr:hypothetical protein BpHYR1_001303 [Brachionus plicatilis]